jgi:flagellar basal body-associated protein FliL
MIVILVSLMVVGLVGMFIAMKFMLRKHDSIALPVKCWLCRREDASRFFFDAEPFNSSYKFVCSNCLESSSTK